MNPAVPEAVRGDDLFQFDELEAGAPAPALPAAGPAAKPAPPDMTPDAGDAPAAALRPMGLVDDTAAELEPVAPEPRPAPQSSLPPVVVPLLLVVASANLILVGLTWQSLRRPPAVPPAVETLASAPAETAGGHGEAAALRDGPGGALRQAAPRRLGSRDDAHAILSEAERTLVAGEFVEARRSLYALLAVLDRLEVRERDDVEARAGFLIAETYRQEALALGARGGEHAGDPAPGGEEPSR